MTPQLLLAAYVAHSGLTLTLTYSRQMSLTQLCEMGMTTEDMKRVLTYIKTQIKIGTKGFTYASLDFRNSVSDVEKFEEIAQRLRVEADRKRRDDKPVPREQSDGKGVLRVLDAPEQPEPAKVDSTLIAEQFRNFANQLGRAS